MDTAAIQPSAHRLTGARVIFWAGLIAGTLDLTGACVVAWLRTGATPVRIFQSVATEDYIELLARARGDCSPVEDADSGRRISAS